MARLYVVLTFVDIAFMIFAFVDVLLTQDWRVRGVPKIVWLAIVLLLSPIGGILWFFAGKEPIDGSTPPPQQKRRSVAPDDDPEFLARMRVKEHQDERIRELEQQLAELDDEQTDPGDNKNDTQNS